MKFSVILTTYNRGGTFLKQAIRSVVNQTYKNWELIIFDNYSADNTDEIVSEFKSDKIKYMKLRNDGVIAKSRNAGIKESTGEYVALIDSDDFWEVNKLEKSHHYLSANNCDGFCHAENWLFDDNKKMVVSYGPEERFAYKTLLLFGNCLSPSATIVKREILNEVGGYTENEKFITAEDYDLWLKISKKRYKFMFSNEILGNFRVHSGAESYNTIKNATAVTEVIKSHYMIKEEGRIDTAICNCWVNAGKVSQVRGDYKYASTAYVKAIKYNWLSIKSWLLFSTLLIPHKFFILVYDFIKSRK
jgi:glycosyltransferase involved in cell wall biosynthesis